MPDDLLQFQLLEVPAAGAFATLCVARLRDGRLVALKVLKSDYVQNADALTRLRDEARVLRRVRHPNIVRVDELMNLDGRPVLFMEWVEGLSLEQLLQRANGGLSAPVVVAMVRKIALALDAAFNSTGADGRPMRIIHRDIKPSNVLMSRDGEIKVVDFGLAKGDFEDRESRTTFAVVGSRGYSAPERLDGDPDTPSVDVYALGISLFELLTGKLPVISRHPDRHDNAMLESLIHINSDELDPAAVTHLKHLVRRMCLYEPELRPTHQRVADDILALLGGQELDLADYAAHHVRPVVDARARPSPADTPHYDEIQFLEAFSEWDTLDDPNTTEAASDAHLRQFLQRGGWARRVPELQVLLANSARWTPEPFLELLDRASKPRWYFWNTRPSDEEVALALEFLRQRASDPVRSRARRFVRHGDPRVSDAARALLQDA